MSATAFQFSDGSYLPAAICLGVAALVGVLLVRKRFWPKSPQKIVVASFCALVAAGVWMSPGTPFKSAWNTESPGAASARLAANPEVPAIPADDDGTTERRAAPEAEYATSPSPPLVPQPPIAGFATLPEGPFKQRLQTLEPATRDRAMASLDQLGIPREDLASLRVDANGVLYYVCVFPRHQDPGQGKSGSDNPESTSSLAAQATPITESVPISAPPSRHSRPSSLNVIYLDFNGEVIRNTAWNKNYGIAEYQALPFSQDQDLENFSPLEQAIIIETWERVAEDFAPFDVDVTTEEPAVFNSRTGRVLITGKYDAQGLQMPDADSASGYAYINVFGLSNYASYYSPALVYASSGHNYADELAETVSHEMGHNLGLSHDGRTDGTEYYRGHGSGATSWHPIMGSGSNRNVTQWSKGEYYLANNTQDDLAIISSKINYRQDEAGATIGTAAIVPIQGGHISIRGHLANGDDVDYFRFESLTGRFTIAAKVFASANDTRGNNADLAIALLRDDGTIVAEDDPATLPDAALSVDVTAGTYYLRVTPTGTGDPLSSNPTGYTNYGSAGEYTLNGQIPSIPYITYGGPEIIDFGFPISANIFATADPSSFAAAGLPPGVSLDPSSGAITGRPQAVGVFHITISATNNLGTGSSTFDLTIEPGPPAIYFEPAHQAHFARVGDAIAITSATLNVGGTVSYQWKHNGFAIPGATSPSLVLSSVELADDGYYQVVATNALGTAGSPPAFVRVAPRRARAFFWGNQSLSPGALPTADTDYIDFGLQDYSAYGLTHEGAVIAMGSSTPVPANLGSVVALACGNYHTLALQADGTVVGWGSNGSTQLNIPSEVHDIVAIAAQDYTSWALRADGRVFVWGELAAHFNTSNATDIVAIATGDGQSIGLRANGTVVLWGNNATAVPDGLDHVVAVAAGYDHLLTLNADGMVVAWGTPNPGAAQVPIDLGPVRAIAAAGYSSFALTEEGEIRMWGDAFANSPGNPPLPSDYRDFYHLNVAGSRAVAFRDTSNDQPPRFTQQPGNTIITESESVTLVGAVESVFPVTYQWLHNGDPLPGQTTSTLTISPAFPADAGTYQLVATNEVGETPSEPVTLTVRSFPLIKAASPHRQLVATGDSFDLWATATGSGQLHYQWFHDGRPIIGATQAYHMAGPATTDSAGLYWARITDDIGTRQSPLLRVDVDQSKTRILSWGHTPAIYQTPTGQDPVEIAAGYDFALSLETNGTVHKWGYSNNVPDAGPVTLDDVVQIVAGTYHALALRADGTVVAWGRNSDGQTNVPERLTEVVAIAAGTQSSLALRADGSVVAWGRDGNGASLTVPSDLRPCIALAAGNTFQIGLHADGTVTTWGVTGNPALQVPENLDHVVNISARAEYALALQADGQVVAWGSGPNGETSVPSYLPPTASIVAGNSTAAVIDRSGILWTWGSSLQGLRNPPVTGAGFRQVAIGTLHALALHRGNNDYSPVITTQPTSQSLTEGDTLVLTVELIATPAPTYQWRRDGVDLAGQTGPTLSLSNLAIDDSGSYDVIARNYLGAVASQPASVVVYPPLGVWDAWPNRQIIRPGHPLHLTTYGTTPGPLEYQWYRNGRALPGETHATLSLAETEIVDAGYYRVAVTSTDGSSFSRPAYVFIQPAGTYVAARGSNNQEQTTVPDTHYRPIAVSGGWYSSIALMADNSLSVWGGNAATNLRPTPSVTDLVEISIGDMHALALRKNGDLIAWGRGLYGQQNVPAGLRDVLTISAAGINSGVVKRDGTVQVWGSDFHDTQSYLWDDKRAIDIACGERHALVLTEDGTVIARGRNNSGQCDVPAGLTEVISVAAGISHSLALRADGTVVAWGANESGQCNVPTGLSEVIAISAGGLHSLALRRDGSIISWGDSGQGARDIDQIGYKASALAGGYFHSLALVAAGSNAPASYQRFVSESFPGSQKTQTTVVAEEADPDGDGMSNILEYAFASDPWDANGAQNPPRFTQVDGTTSLTFQRPRDASDIDYVVEASNDLTTWVPITLAPIDMTVVPLNETTEQVSASLSMVEEAVAPQFLRIRVEPR